MNASAWIALASLAALVSIQGIGFAFMFGKMFQDLATLKLAAPERNAQGLAIARLEVRMEHVATKLDDMSGKIDERLGFLQSPAAYAPHPRRKVTGKPE